MRPGSSKPGVHDGEPIRETLISLGKPVHRGRDACSDAPTDELYDEAMAPSGYASLNFTFFRSSNDDQLIRQPLVSWLRS